MSSGKKSKWWRLLCYPESMQTSFDKFAEMFQIEFAVSPLHTPPLPEKPHYHVLLHFNNAKSQSFVQDISTSCFSGKLPFTCDSPIGSYEYLTHKNDQNKEQFEGDPVLYNGFVPPVRLEVDNNKLLSWVFSEVLVRPEVRNYGDLIAVVLGEDLSALSCCTKYAYAINCFLNAKERSVKKSET